MWDLEDLVQGSGNTENSRSAVADSDSDSDRMDMDDNLPKPSKGIYFASFEIYDD